MSRPPFRRSLELEVRTESIPLRSPFHIAGYRFDALDLVVVQLRDGDLIGRGEAAGVYYLSDTVEPMIMALESLRGAIEAGLSHADIASLLPAGGARNALDCAMWELEARRSGWPVWMLAGLGQPRPLVTTFTLSAEAPETVAHDAAALPYAKALKLKLTGDDPDLDAARVLAARTERPDAWLSVDGNQGFTPDRLQRLLPTLTRSRVALLEQPFPRGREAWMGEIDCPIATAADESVQGLAELETLRGFDMINIKLDKCGGLTEGLAMARQARRMGLGVMVGSMAGTSWAMAPGFLLGQLCDVVDLDGAAVLSADRTPGVHYAEGAITCTDSVWGAPAMSPPRRPRLPLWAG